MTKQSSALDSGASTVETGHSLKVMPSLDLMLIRTKQSFPGFSCSSPRIPARMILSTWRFAAECSRDVSKGYSYFAAYFGAQKVIGRRLY